MLGSKAAQLLQPRRTLWAREAVLGLVVVALLAGGSISLTSATDSGSSQVPSPLQAVALGFYWVSVYSTSCYLNTGVCTTDIVNTGTNSSYDLQVLGCQIGVITFSNPYNTAFAFPNGTVAGFETTISGQGETVQTLPHGGIAYATCYLPPSQLTLEPIGQAASGTYRMELVNSLGSRDAGTSALVGFGGTWMASPITTTLITSNTTLTSTSTLTSTATYTTTATATVTSNGGPPSELPYQLTLVVLAVALVLVSYLHVRRRPVG